MSQPFAVFDIDGTIFRSSLFLEMTYRAIEKGVFPKSMIGDINASREAWKKRKYSEAYDEYVMSTVESFERNFTGVEAVKLQAIAKEVVDEYHEHTYVYTRDLLRELKAKGYFLIAITGSLEEVATEFTKRYDFDFVRATYLYQKDGKYTGEFSAADTDKQSELKKIVADNNLSFKDSYGVGDTSSDIGLLELVQNPIAFNPDKKLFATAKEKNWQIVVERKNMIYKMEKVNGSYILAETNA